MTRVVICTSAHPHDDVRIFHKEAISLARGGYEVFLLNSEYGGDKLGVHFVQVPPLRGRLARMAVSWRRCARAAWALRPDVCHMHDPELLPMCGYLRRRGVKIAYDAHEDLPKQVLGKPWLPGLLRPAAARAAGRLEKYFLRRCDMVFCATELIAGRFLGITNAVALHNYPRLSEFPPTVAPREAIVCYVGALTASRGVLEIARAADTAGVKLVLAGRFETRGLESELMRLTQSGYVSYAGVLGRAEVAALMSRCAAGLVLLHPTPAYRESVPIKMLEYMAAGIPVIASDFLSWRELLKGTDCAVFVNPLDENAIAGAMRRLTESPDEAHEMGLRGRAAVCGRFCWESEEKVLLRGYSAILHRDERK